MTTEPQKAWWEERVRALFHSVWGASPWNEERMTDTSIEILKDVFRKQQTRDWEEFRALLDAHMMKSGMRRDIDALRGVREDIEAKLSSLKSDK